MISKLFVAGRVARATLAACCFPAVVAAAPPEAKAPTGTTAAQVRVDKDTTVTTDAEVRVGGKDTTVTTAGEVSLAGKDTDLRYDLALDLGITLGGAALALTLEIFNSDLAPSSCRWCDRDASGRDTLNGFDSSMRDALRWSDVRTADTTSSVFSYALAPLTGVGAGAFIAWYDDRLEELPVDLLIVAEAAVLAENVNQITKFITARERPDVHARSPEERRAKQTDADNLSFFSGHTTLAFALATSAGTVATMRRHRIAPMMWVTGMLLATGSGYLRIAADRHYATDVIAGALVGSAIGFGVPYLAHRPSPVKTRVAVLPAPEGAVFLLLGQF